MKEHGLYWHDDERARGYAAQIHRLNDEPLPTKPKSNWRRRAVAGVIVGSIGYLLTTCFLEQQLHKPKMERAKFRFGHAQTEEASEPQREQLKRFVR